METLKIKDSKYHFEYEKDEEYNFKIFRYNEDITYEVKNNIIVDMFYALLDKESKLWAKKD